MKNMYNKIKQRNRQLVILCILVILLMQSCVSDYIAPLVVTRTVKTNNSRKAKYAITINNGQEWIYTDSLYKIGDTILLK